MANKTAIIAAGTNDEANQSAQTQTNLTNTITKLQNEGYEVVVIPPNSAIELIQGGAKIVLASGDVLEAVSDTASSLDVVCSYIDTISS